MTWRINPHKYKAKKVRLHGFVFDSQAESKRYLELHLLEKAGKISKLTVHPKFEILHDGVKICSVILDFQYFDSARGWVVEDVKGYDTPLSRLKRKLVKEMLNVEVQIIR